MRAASTSRMSEPLPAGTSSAPARSAMASCRCGPHRFHHRPIGRAVAWLHAGDGADLLHRPSICATRCSIGLIWLQELYVWTHVAAIMLGAGYVLLRGGFVRVDLLYAAMSERGKAWVDLLGTLFLMMPFLVMMAISGWSFFLTSLAMNEPRNMTPACRGLWLLKGTLIVFVAAGRFARREPDSCARWRPFSTVASAASIRTVPSLEADVRAPDVVAPDRRTPQRVDVRRSDRAR